jgi:hypothetical protein
MKKLAFFLTVILLTTSCTQLNSFFNIKPVPKTEIQPEMIQLSKLEIQSEMTPPKKIDVSLKPAPQDNDIIYPLYERGVVVDCENHIQDVKNILGEPDFVNVEESINPHFPTQIDEKHELSYQGLNILVYVFEHKDLVDDTSIIIGFTLTGNQYYLPGNIQIGSPFSQVKKQITPLQPKPKKDYFLYTNIFEEGYEEAIRFYFTEEKLSKVVWYCAIN